MDRNKLAFFLLVFAINAASLTLLWKDIFSVTIFIVGGLGPMQNSHLGAEWLAFGVTFFLLLFIAPYILVAFKRYYISVTLACVPLFIGIAIEAAVWHYSFDSGHNLHQFTN